MNRHKDSDWNAWKPLLAKHRPSAVVRRRRLVAITVALMILWVVVAVVVRA